MSIENIIVLIKGGGEMATGIAHRLNRCHFKVCMTEISHPQAVRREVSFCEAVYDREKTVEGLTAKLVDSCDRIPEVWDTGKICQVLNLSNFELIPLDITDFVILCILNISELQRYLVF